MGVCNSRCLLWAEFFIYLYFQLIFRICNSCWHFLCVFLDLVSNRQGMWYLIHDRSALQITRDSFNSKLYLALVLTANPTRFSGRKRKTLIKHGQIGRSRDWLWNHSWIILWTWNIPMCKYELIPQHFLHLPTVPFFVSKQKVLSYIQHHHQINVKCSRTTDWLKKNGKCSTVDHGDQVKMQISYISRCRHM